MNPSFSFTYGGKAVTSETLTFTATPDGAVYTLEPGVTVTCKETRHDAYGALEWVLSFANTSGHDSGVFAEICDCDALLSLPVPAPKRPGFMPKEGDACVIAYRGMVDGRLYQENDAVSAVCRTSARF